jgi:hypothetical protein
MLTKDKSIKDIQPDKINEVLITRSFKDRKLFNVLGMNKSGNAVVSFAVDIPYENAVNIQEEKTKELQHTIQMKV